jgi:RNA-binding protein YlmH
VDCLAAHVFHLSRSQASRLIEQEKIFADGRIITSASYISSPGERISVRGYGKFRYLGTDGKTRKGRLIARYERYI